MRSAIRKRAPALLILGVFGVTFTGSYAGAIPFADVSIRWRTNGVREYAPALRTEPGPELAFVYIGSASCAASNWDPLPGIIEELKLALREKARENGRAFTAVGVARDWDVESGLDHLRGFGSFDEVMAGRNWLNTGVVKYVWEDLPGRAATPQVLVIDRRVVSRTDPAAAEGVIRDARVVARKVGNREIEQWLALGAPLPRLRPSSAD